jgi:cytoskeletal protein CcmA (bactofilin family)
MHNIHRLRIYSLLAVFAVSLCVVSVPRADAATLKSGDAYTVASDTEIVGDLYVAGKEFRMYGTTTGDVIAATLQDIETRGTITDDAFLAAPIVTVGGKVDGDVRIVGGQVKLEGTITEDVVAAGLHVVVAENAVIQGDVFIVAADRIDVYGTIEGNAQLHADTIAIYGTLGDDARVHAGEVFVAHDAATIRGNIDYSAPKEMLRSTSATIEGTVTYTGKTAHQESHTHEVVLRVIAVLVLALLFLLLMPQITRNTAARIASTANGLALVWGIATLAGFPLLAALLFMTGIGVLPAVLVLLCYGVLLLVTVGYVPVVLGTLIARTARLDPQKYLWQSVVMGSVAWVVVWMVPFVGMVLGVIFFAITFGELVRALYAHARSTRNQ